MRTLIVLSQSEEARVSLADIAASRGHDVTALADVGSACAALASEDYTLVVAGAADDCRDAAEVCRRLRAAAGRQGVWLLGVASDSDAGAADRLLLAGADDCVSPSCDPPEAHLRLRVAESRLGRRAPLPSAAPSPQTDEDWHSIFDGMPDGMLIADIETLEVVCSNAAVRELLGYREEELLAMHVADVHPDAVAPMVEARIRQFPQEGVAKDSELPCARKDGSVFYADVTGRLITYRGRPSIVAFFRDVTARKKADEALVESEARFRAIFANAALGIAVTDLDGHILEANRPFGRMIGCRPEELFGQDIATLTHPEDFERERPLLHELKAGIRDTVQLEKRYRRRDGGVIWVRLSASLIRDVRGRPMFVLGMIEDIDARRRAEQAKREVEQALRRSESRLRNLVENMPDFMVLVNREGVIRYVNHAASSATGPDVVGTVCFQYVAPQHLDQGRYIVERAFQTGEVQTTVGAHAAGSWWEARIVPLPAEGGERTAMLICTDITRRRQAEQALRESEGKLRGLFENLPDFVIVVDRTSIIRFVNRPVGPLTIEDLEGSRGFGWIARGFEAKARLALDSACQTFQVQRVEVADVFNLWWDCRVVPLVEDGEVDNVMIICTDVTERKHSEEILRKEQKLLRRLLDLHERDRRVMAYEIHDSFAQMLAGAQLNFQAFQRDVKPTSRAAESFNEGMRLLEGSIKETRRLISGLRPPVLDELGVVAAVEYLVCEHRTPGGPVIEYSAEVDFERLAPPLESAIFRIVQECLANACRHSRTDRIRVEMAERDDDVWIEVRDWGEGFETDRVDKSRFGLQGIRERARLLGGRATVESAPGVGTRVTVRLPLVHEPPEEHAQ